MISPVDLLPARFTNYSEKRLERFEQPVVNEEAVDHKANPYWTEDSFIIYISETGERYTITDREEAYKRFALLKENSRYPVALYKMIGWALNNETHKVKTNASIMVELNERLAEERKKIEELEEKLKERQEQVYTLITRLNKTQKEKRDLELELLNTKKDSGGTMPLQG